jgi:glycerophosphoryl diester phosphodiesterase
MINTTKFARVISITLLVLTQWSCAMNKQVKNSINPNNTNQKLVIAHRGASGYLPEHSIASKAMAHAMGADYIEQDVVMTKDDQLVVLHDPYLDRVTDVMEQFPNRSREVFGQTRWLAIDFTLAEIKQLNMTEGFSLDSKTNEKIKGYSSRFPLFKSSFKVSTLAEEIELIQGMNFSRGKHVGIYVEIKAPWFHLLEGKDISKATLTMIKQYGYYNKSDKVFIQCFDPKETKRIKQEVMPSLSVDYKLVQLIAETSWEETMELVDGKLVPYNYDWFFEKGAMQKIAQYADAIGPWKPMLLKEESSIGDIQLSIMAIEAKKAGLKMHPYTFRKDAGRIPKYAKDFDDLLNIFYNQIDVDGVFTDFPDLAVKFLENN